MKVAKPGVEIFSGRVDTACGPATSAVGPFYCPGDRVAYFDTAFFADLQNNYGSDGGPLAEEYVVAHEYGHHIQNTIGTLAASQQGGTGANSGSVRVELQADCFAGMWAGYAAQTKDANGNTFMKPLTEVGPALGALRGLRRGRRPDPEGGHRAGQPRGLDARLGRPARGLVPAGLQDRRHQQVRHPVVEEPEQARRLSCLNLNAA